MSCLLRSVPEPFAPRRGGSTATGLAVMAPCTLTWADGGVDVFIPGPAADAVEIYHFTTHVDTTSKTWLVVAVKGLAAPLLAREEDEGTLDSLIAAIPATGIALPPSWAVLGWLEGATFHRSRRTIGAADAASAAIVDLFAGGRRGDILRCIGPGTWERYHIGDPADVLTVQDGLPVWSSQVQPVTTTQSGSRVANTVGLALWNGATNNNPPAGWNQPGTDRSGWSPTIVTVAGPAFDSLSTVAVLPNIAYEEVFVQTFALPAGAISAATIMVHGDLGVRGAWVNGTFIPGTSGGTGTGPHNQFIAMVAVAPALLAQNGSPNIIAVWAYNNLGTDQGSHGTNWQLTANQ